MPIRVRKNVERPEWAKWVLHRCVDREWRQQDLAAAAGWSGAFLSDALRGNRTPTPHMLNKISAALDVTADEQRELHTLAARAAGYNV